ncbi:MULTISPECIES: hypothetical protein [Actinomadura]|jgi:hypothetical protein|uniref:hypothetical protein n=1 Tax=Actinomadura TaxID=1988 RepID=UPI00178C7974|nr:hypothetical protein [Actinomadura montaniterrae]HEU5027337.1 hypothetical protein [Spirillospora sp.]
MPYGSAATGGTLAYTGFAMGHVWLAATGLGLVLVGTVLVRLGFRRGRGPLER